MNETVTNCQGLWIKAIDGKTSLTDAADTEQLFRLIQFQIFTKNKIL